PSSGPTGTGDTGNWKRLLTQDESVVTNEALESSRFRRNRFNLRRLYDDQRGRVSAGVLSETSELRPSSLWFRLQNSDLAKCVHQCHKCLLQLISSLRANLRGGQRRTNDFMETPLLCLQGSDLDSQTRNLLSPVLRHLKTIRSNDAVSLPQKRWNGGMKSRWLERKSPRPKTPGTAAALAIIDQQPLLSSDAA
ncbi:MAG: hypothetical protein WBY75_04415, partial [Terracidiphilus sp.]